MLKEKSRKTLRYLVIITMLVFSALAYCPYPAKAFFNVKLFDITQSVMEKISTFYEDRYHLNQGTMQEYGENMNVSWNKGSAPEVMLTFSPSDPKEGEKLTATALPMYFSTPTESLYFTWYLKHEECNLNKNPSRRIIDLCDKNNDNKITVEDWKIEAMRLIANNGFKYSEKAHYNTDVKDNDGYRAHMGGDSNIRPATNYHCYIHDFKNGDNYEITNAESDIATAFYLSDGTICTEDNVRCVRDDTLICSSAEYQICEDSSNQPYCDVNSCTGDNCDAICPDGTSAYCATSSSLGPECSEISADAPCSSVGNAISYCTTSVAQNKTTNDLVCEHLFPNAPGYETGDNLFPPKEEKFWRTDPEDPDTANSGNGDEANVAGLGITEFTWNYALSDRIGVVIEGESMASTKHDDSSIMIMWALPKNKCEVENKGSYTKEIKGYDVTIPTAGVDINGCLVKNLVDPREGGQPKNLEVSLSYSPENPINDPTGDDAGDEVTVQSIISNADQPTSQIYYKWEVKISRNGTFSLDDSDWIDITDEFLPPKMENGISLTEGNDVSSLGFSLNLKESVIENYLRNGVGYLRVYADVEESFNRGMTRSGNSDVIIKFTSSGKKIIPYTINVDSNDNLLSINRDNSICQDDIMQKSICFVVKNEIIGVSVSDTDLRNFSWKLNGEPLVCDSSISEKCSDSKQTKVNFFPVTGNVGDTYALTLDANDISFNESDLNSVHLVRNFQIVEPSVKIISPDESFKPKLLGHYYDLEGNEFEDESEMVFQAVSGNEVSMKADFFPEFIGGDNLLGNDPRTKVQWLVNGLEVMEGDESERVKLVLLTNKPAGTVYNIAFNALYEQPIEIRKALKDIWGISQFKSTENRMSNSVQIEMVENSNPNTTMLKGSQKALASLLSHFPEQAMFLLRILLTVLMIIFVSGAVLSISPRRN